MTTEEAIKSIREQNPRSTYSNNVVGACLRAVASEEGADAADAIIRKLGLEKKYNISPVGKG